MEAASLQCSGITPLRMEKETKQMPEENMAIEMALQAIQRNQASEKTGKIHRRYTEIDPSYPDIDQDILHKQQLQKSFSNISSCCCTSAKGLFGGAAVTGFVAAGLFTGGLAAGSYPLCLASIYTYAGAVCEFFLGAASVGCAKVYNDSYWELHRKERELLFDRHNITKMEFIDFAYSQNFGDKEAIFDPLFDHYTIVCILLKRAWDEENQPSVSQNQFSEELTQKRRELQKEEKALAEKISGALKGGFIRFKLATEIEKEMDI